MNKKKGPVKFNVKNAHYAVRQEDELGNVQYGTPIPLPGAKSITLDPEGDTSVFYADGIKYYVSVGNQGYSGNMELAFLPDYFRKDVLNEKEDEETHVLLEDANAEGATFAFLFQVDKSDGTPVLFLFYDCTASRPSVSANTKTAGKEPDTDTLNFNAAPLEDGIIRAKTTERTPKELVQNWFKKVWLPGSGTLSEVMETLSVQSTAGTSSGKTAVAVTPALTDGNLYRIKAAGQVEGVPYGTDCSSNDYQDWDGSSEIDAANGDKLLVVECTADGKAQKYGITTVTAAI